MVSGGLALAWDTDFEKRGEHQARQAHPDTRAALAPTRKNVAKHPARYNKPRCPIKLCYA